MRLFKRDPAASGVPDLAALNDPERALRVAEEALVMTRTHVDEHGRRREMPAAMRERVVHIRRSRGRCGTSIPLRMRRAACSHRVISGSLRRSAGSGLTTVSFTARIGTARLRRGTYVATLVATGTDGRVGKPATVRFRVRF